MLMSGNMQNIKENMHKSAKYIQYGVLWSAFLGYNFSLGPTLKKYPLGGTGHFFGAHSGFWPFLGRSRKYLAKNPPHSPKVNASELNFEWNLGDTLLEQIWPAQILYLAAYTSAP